MQEQQYVVKPTELEDINGLSSKTIYNFMTTGIYYVDSNYPHDVDDWERNRALLLCYPEWKSRLLEMSVISKYWKILVENWDKIESQYNNDLITYGDNAFGLGECDKFVRSLLKSVKSE